MSYLLIQKQKLIQGLEQHKLRFDHLKAKESIKSNQSSREHFQHSEGCFHLNRLFTIEAKRRGPRQAIFCASSELVGTCYGLLASCRTEKFLVAV